MNQRDDKTKIPGNNLEVKNEKEATVICSYNNSLPLDTVAIPDN